MTELTYWHNAVDADLRDHESRLRTLEKGFWRLGGILAVCGVVASLVGGGVVTLALHFLT